MSDPFDRYFDQLRGQPPPAPFVPAEAVRRRGRQRTFRQAGMVGVAVFALTSVGAGSVAAVVGPTDPPPAASPTITEAPASPLDPSPQPDPTRTTTSEPPPPSDPPSLDPSLEPTDPARTEVPGEWLLTAADLGPGSWAAPESDPWELENGPWIWLTRCVYETGFDAAQQAYPSLRDRRDLALVSWQDGERESTDPGWRLNQTVELFDAGAGAANLADVEEVVAACVDGAWQVADRGLAGDESLLVAAPDGWFYTVVRVGDAVATVMSTDEALLREVTPRAADRLH